MALKAVHHIALLVSDYQKSKEFYVDKLGFRIVRENFREDRGDYKLDLILNGVELEIFAPAQKDHEHQLHPARPNFPEAYGLRHLAFTVTDIEKKQPQNSGKRELRQNLSGWMNFQGESLPFLKIRTDCRWSCMNN